jgi:hypothetical protein
MYAPGRCMSRVIVLALCTVSVSHAQESQKAAEKQEFTPARTENWPERSNVWPTHWYEDWEWWAGEAVLAGEEFGDSYTTANRCKGCQETNPLLGHNPSNSQIIALSLVSMGISTTLHIVSWKVCPDVNRRARSWRFACNAFIPGISSAIKIPVILHNSHLDNSAARPSSTSSTVMPNRVSGGALSGGYIPETLRRANRTPFPPRSFGECRLPFCTSSRFAGDPKVDLSKVELVHR